MFTVPNQFTLTNTFLSHLFSSNYRKWENAIVNYIGSDPLELWFNFIYWYEQNQQYDTENLFETSLGKCLSTYETEERYKQDQRMVKLWMKYVSFYFNLLKLCNFHFKNIFSSKYTLFTFFFSH